MIYGEYQAGYLDRLSGQVDIVYRQGQWYLYATIVLPDPTPLEPADFLGVDLGVINLATTSDGSTHSGAGIEACRSRYLRRRRRLQRSAIVSQIRGRRPKNIRRALKRMARRERAKTPCADAVAPAGFRRTINHQISKTLVAVAADTSRVI